MDALAGDGGVGRERVSVSPGSVSFGDRGKLFFSAPALPIGPSCTVRRRVVVESWLSAKASVARSMSRGWLCESRSGHWRGYGLVAVVSG